MGSTRTRFWSHRDSHGYVLVSVAAGSESASISYVANKWKLYWWFAVLRYYVVISAELIGVMGSEADDYSLA